MTSPGTRLRWAAIAIVAGVATAWVMTLTPGWAMTGLSFPLFIAWLGADGAWR